MNIPNDVLKIVLVKSSFYVNGILSIFFIFDNHFLLKAFFTETESFNHFLSYVSLCKVSVCRNMLVQKQQSSNIQKVKTWGYAVWYICLRMVPNQKYLLRLPHASLQMALFWILLRSFILSLIHHMPIEHYKQKKTFGPFVVFQGGVDSLMQFHKIWIPNFFLYDKSRVKWKYPSNLILWYIKSWK